MTTPDNGSEFVRLILKGCEMMKTAQGRRIIRPIVPLEPEIYDEIERSDPELLETGRWLCVRSKRLSEEKP